MDAASKSHIDCMRSKHHMTDIELWRDTMCGQMKIDGDYCNTPDGNVLFVNHACWGVCRYSNHAEKYIEAKE